VNSYYGPFRTPAAKAAATLHDYQAIVRVTGPLLLVLVALSVGAVLLARGRSRWGAVLLASTGMELLLVPALVLGAQWRYAMPALGPLAAGAALGLWASAVSLRRAHWAWVAGRSRLRCP